LVARARALRRSINDVAAPQDTASHEKLSTNVLRPLLGTL